MSETETKDVRTSQCIQMMFHAIIGNCCLNICVSLREAICTITLMITLLGGDVCFVLVFPCLVLISWFSVQCFLRYFQSYYPSLLRVFYAICYQVKNPFENNQVVGITNYIDLGLELAGG